MSDDVAQGLVVGTDGIYPAETNGMIVWSQDVLSIEVGVCFAWLKKGTERQ